MQLCDQLHPGAGEGGSQSKKNHLPSIPPIVLEVCSPGEGACVCLSDASNSTRTPNTRSTTCSKARGRTCTTYTTVSTASVPPRQASAHQCTHRPHWSDRHARKVLTAPRVDDDSMPVSWQRGKPHASSNHGTTELVTNGHVLPSQVPTHLVLSDRPLSLCLCVHACCSDPATSLEHACLPARPTD